MPHSARNAAVISLLLIFGGCVTNVRDIQATSPVRTAKFTGSPKAVAACIQARIGGKVARSDLVESQDYLIIYDSVRGLSSQGLSHYSMTVRRTGTDAGIVEWRIVNSMAPATGNPPPLADAMVQRFWIPAQECAKSAS